MAKKTNNKKTATNKVKKATIKKETILQDPPIDLEVLEEALKETIVDEPTEVEVVNGDPTVVAPVENKEETMENNSFHSFGPKKVIIGKNVKDQNPHETTSLVPENNTEEPQVEEWDSVKPAREKVETKPRRSSFKKIVDYFWNGQEMDY